MSIFAEIPRNDLRRRVLRRYEWPAIDERLFIHGCTPADVFDEDERPGADWTEPTLRKIIGAYGRWLGFLAETGKLDPDIHPADRVIAPRVRAYLALLREVGLSDFSIVGLFADLRTALRVMAPERDFAWLTNPCGASLRSRLPMKRRDFEVPSSLILYEWGVDLMHGALDLRGDVRRRVQYRDGLLIAIFAARARRHRAMAGLHLGREVIRHGDAYRVIIPPELIKGGARHKKCDEFSLPVALTAYVDRYLEIERQELLAGEAHDAFWVNWDGAPLGYRGIDKRIRWLSVKKFGFAFGPHRFRYSAATSAAIDAASLPGLGAAMLNITGEVAERHYNRAKQVDAAEKYHATVARVRRTLRSEWSDSK
ncbi:MULTISPECIES: hypothetical protein [unclassified Acidiphilium]|uniref:hypothetical protein n=1 Tax=unclassified Acidiphilium TaxID=2617493 RepID=UPI000BD2950B|nr:MULTISPECIES: hypothetical protein [unclassified Acidiphilium]OYV57464.1 MAG: hypothetical protein B7Z76_01430 [Acidiphilium sp. 20-67-58]HQT59667.1 hypothetical protein [Acidiphilium sp.]